ncbi:MAG: glycosyltransferase family 4 protein [Candidatus Omnitrophota bacterium]
MNILLLANHFNHGGITAYILNLCRALHGKEDIQMVVASRGGDCQPALAALGVRHIRLPLTTKCEVSPKVYYSFLKLQGERFDVIHAHTRVTQVLACLLSRATGRPFVSTCHGYFKTRLSRRLFPCWGKKVIAISDQVKAHLVCDFHVKEERVELVYSGIDLDKFHSHSAAEISAQKKAWGLDPAKKIIGHIGRLSSVKGQKFLVQAAVLLSRQRSDLQFLIVGEGDQESRLRSLIQEKDAGGVVVLQPSVADTSLALSLMDVFAMPSLQEGLGLSILEAQAQGVPVVASRVGGIPTVIEDGKTGLFCPAGNAEALAHAISRLLDDSLLRQALIRQGRRNVEERFSLHLMADKMKTLYRTVACCA